MSAEARARPRAVTGARSCTNNTAIRSRPDAERGVLPHWAVTLNLTVDGALDQQVI